MLELLLAAANEFHGAVSVADALRLDLGDLASDLGIVEAVDSYRIQDLTDVRIVVSVIDDVRDMRATMPERKVTILEEYLFARKTHDPRRARTNLRCHAGTNQTGQEPDRRKRSTGVWVRRLPLLRLCSVGELAQSLAKATCVRLLMSCSRVRLLERSSCRSHSQNR